MAFLSPRPTMIVVIGGSGAGKSAATSVLLAGLSPVPRPGEVPHAALDGGGLFIGRLPTPSARGGLDSLYKNLPTVVDFLQQRSRDPAVRYVLMEGEAATRPGWLDAIAPHFNTYVVEVRVPSAVLKLRRAARNTAWDRNATCSKLEGIASHVALTSARFGGAIIDGEQTASEVGAELCRLFRNVVVIPPRPTIASMFPSLVASAGADVAVPSDADLDPAPSVLILERGEGRTTPPARSNV
jgi:hypothetical protein